MTEPVSLVVFGSVKGSPGATTAAVGIAAWWPDPRWTPVIECDPAGGDLAARFGLAPEPNLVGLAAALRQGAPEAAAPDTTLPDTTLPGVEVVSEHAQRVELGVGRAVDVVCAPPAPAAARTAMKVIASGPCLPAIRGGAGTVALIDCGRLDADSAAAPLLAAADVIVVVVRSRLEDLAHLSAEAPRLRHAARGPVVVLMVGGDFPAGEVNIAIGLPVVGALPVDRQGVRVLNGLSERVPRRASLPAALTRAALVIASMAEQVTPAGPDSPVPTSPAPAAPAPVSSDPEVVSR